MHPTIIRRNELHTLAVWNNVLIESAVGAPTLEGQRNVERALASLMERFPNGVAYVVHLPAGIPVPDGAVRSEITRLLKGLDRDRMLGFALIVAAEGFWAAAARSASRASPR